MKRNKQNTVEGYRKPAIDIKPKEALNIARIFGRYYPKQSWSERIRNEN